MSLKVSRFRSTNLFKVFTAFVMGGFIFSGLLPQPLVWGQPISQSVLELPVPGAMVASSENYRPASIKGITLQPNNPLRFDFIIDPGEVDLDDRNFADESMRLVRYFLASLTMPEKDMWVNLSPYENNRIITENFVQTEMGRDLLAQDYLLKQLTASLMYPENELGQHFWKRVYEKAYATFGTTDIPMNTYNKVWIVPDKAVVYQHGDSVFIMQSQLKVMLEEDYLALAQNGVVDHKSVNVPRIGSAEKQSSNVSSKIIQEIIIPEIEREVNEGKHFSRLRQIYHSLILAAWYKKNLKQGFMSRVYVNQEKIGGVDHQDPAVKERIYDQYIEAFKKGVYNFVKEEYDPNERATIPRQYFSGGINHTMITQSIKKEDQAMTVSELERFLADTQLVGISLEQVVADEVGVVPPANSILHLPRSSVDLKSFAVDHAMVSDLRPEQYRDLAKYIVSGFSDYYQTFLRLTSNAQEYFESDNTEAFIQSEDDRKEIYHKARNEIMAHLRGLFEGNEDRLLDEKFWEQLKAAFSTEIRNTYESDIAHIYLESIQRLMWLSYGKTVEQRSDSVRDASEKSETLSRTYNLSRDKSLQELENDDSLKDILRNIIVDLQLTVNYNELEADLELSKGMILQQLRDEGVDSPVHAIKILMPIFYTPESANVVGKIELNDGSIIPIIIALRREEKQTVIDSVMVGREATYDLLLSTTRSPYHVYTTSYREIAAFTREVYPQAEHFQIYNLIGFPAQYKALTIHQIEEVLGTSDRQLELIGETSEVITFGIEGMPYVFEVIRQDAHDQEAVRKRFRRGHERDRMGQLLDHWVFRSKTFERNHFTDEVFEKLTQGAGVTAVNGGLSFERIYVRKRINRIEDYIRDLSAKKKKDILLRVGRTIKNLAHMGIYPMQLGLEHFGVTSWGQVVYTNTAGLGTIEARTFSHLVDQGVDQLRLETTGEPAHLTVYPETFEDQLQIPEDAREVFNALHGDLFTVEFWNNAKQIAEENAAIDLYPYTRRYRLKVWKLRKEIFDALYGAGKHNSIGSIFGERQVSRAVSQIMNAIVGGEGFSDIVELWNHQEETLDISFAIRDNVLRLYLFYDKDLGSKKDGYHENRGRAWLSTRDIPIDHFQEVIIPQNDKNVFGNNSLFMLLLGENGIVDVSGNKGASFNDFQAMNMKFPPGMTLSVDFVETVNEENIDQFMPEITRVIHQYMWYYMDQDGRTIDTKFKFSVRSSPVTSRPGLLTTTLDVQSTEEIKEGILNVVDKAREVAEKEGVDSIPVAVIIQEMRYGTAGAVNTVNPETGEPGFYGTIINKETGDALMTGGAEGKDFNSLKTERPEVYKQITDELSRLVKERKGNYPQEVEFVIEDDGTVFYLSARDSKFTPSGEINFLKRQVAEGVMSEANTLPRIEELQRRLNGRVLHKVRQGIKRNTLLKGIAKTAGAMQGRLVQDANAAWEMVRRGQPVILFFTKQNQNDMLEVAFSQEAKKAGVGIMTTYGNGGSHEANLTRGAGIPAIINIQDNDVPIVLGIPKKDVPAEEGSVITRGDTQRESTVYVNWGDEVVLDADNNSVFLPLGRKSILVKDKTVEDASHGVNPYEYRLEISAPYLTRLGMKQLRETRDPKKFKNTKGVLRSEYTYEKLLAIRIAAGTEHRTLVKKDAQSKQTTEADWRQHFLHDLVEVAARAEGIESWEFNADIEVLDLIEMLDETGDPRTDWRKYNKTLEELGSRSDLRAVDAIFKKWLNGTPSVRRTAKEVLSNFTSYNTLGELYRLKEEETLPEGFVDVVKKQITYYLAHFIGRLAARTIIDLSESERIAKMVFSEAGIISGGKSTLEEYLSKKDYDLFDDFVSFTNKGLEFKFSDKESITVKRIDGGEFMVDQAQLAVEEKLGGINFNPDLIDLDVVTSNDGLEGAVLGSDKTIAPINLDKNFIGFNPVILKISPINVPMLLGDNASKDPEQLSSLP